MELDGFPKKYASAEVVLQDLAARAAMLPDPIRGELEADLLRLRESLYGSGSQPAQDRPAHLEESRSDYILNSMMEGCMVLDENGACVYFNDEARRMLKSQGIDPASLIGRNARDFIFPGPGIEELFQAIRQSAQERRAVDLVWNYPPWNRWFMVRVVPGQREGVIIFSRDVTDRANAFQMLRDSERNLNDLVKYAPAGIYEVDFREKRFTRVNDAMCELSGYSREELLSMNPFEILDEAGRETFQKRIEQWLAGLQPEQNVEYRVKAKDGHMIHALLNVSFKNDETGRPVGATAVGFDVTKSRQAEVERAEANRLAERNRLILEAVIAQMPAGIVLSDASGGQVQTNAELERIWGYGPADDEKTALNKHTVVGADGSDCCLEECLLNRAMLSGSAAAGVILNEEMAIRRADGTEGIIITSTAPIYDVDGSMIAEVAIVQDITGRKEMENALRESEARERERVREMEALMDAVPALIWIARDANCQTMIGNRYGYQFLKMEPQANLSKTAPENELARQPYQNFKEGRPLPSEELPMQIAAATGQPARDYEFDLQFNSGERVSLLGNVNPLFDGEGKPSGAVGAFVDITALRRLQSQQVEALAEREVHHRLMEQREKERQSYARDIHDGPIQTLSSVVFHVQFIKEGHPDPSLRMELDQVSLGVKSAVQELRQLINELRPPSVIRFGLARAIRIHAEDIQERYPQIDWNYRLTDDPCRLPEQTCLALYRIYQEAVTNVVRHSGATQAWIRYQVKPEKVILEIRDNGKGLDEQQDVESLTRSSHFGLAGIMERVEAINGSLKITTAPEKGTTILVMVPMEERKDEPINR